MIRILLVEDEAEKTRLIAEALFAVSGIESENVERAEDVISAKRQLQAHKFDLLILDIKLPKRIDKPAESSGGLEILRWLKGPGSAHQPDFIIGTTAYSDAFDSAQSEFRNSIWHLIRFAYDRSDWRDLLQRAVELLIQRSVPPYGSDGSSFRVDVGIVAALPEPEMSAVLNLPGNWQRVPVRYDTFDYYLGTFANSRRTLNVVAVCAPRMGLPSSSVTAMKLIYSFWPRYLTMVGISCGITGKVNVGDVLVADPCWDWGSGKLVKVGKSFKLQGAPYQLRVPEEVRAAAAHLSQDVKQLSAIKRAWHGPVVDTELKLYIDAVASGASVLQSREALASIKEQHKNLIGIDMEAFSIMTAAEYSPLPQPKSFVVKGICDYGVEDKHTYDQFRPYAAYVSAQVMYKIVTEFLF